jgi:hypothetical protein
MPLPGVEGDAAYLLTVLEQLLPADDFTGDPARYCLDKMTAFGGCEAVNVLWQRFVRQVRKSCETTKTTGKTITTAI